MLLITCHSGTKGGDGGVRQELPCSSGVRQTATLAQIPGSCHAACTHRFLCKPPLRLIRTVCHGLILPDVNRAIFHAEIKALKWIECKLAYGQAMDHVDQPTKIGPVPLLFKWILVRHYWHGQRAPLLTWSAWVPARRCSHQTTITKSAAPSHGLPHVLRRHRFDQANCTLSWLLVGAEGLAVVELQVDLRSKCCNVATGLWERVPEGAGPDSRVYPRPHALFMDHPWNVQCAPAALDIGHCNVPALLS